jgi:hypothetical protein
MGKRSVSSGEEQIGQPQEYNPAAGELPVDDIEICDTPRWKTKVKELAFMDEFVEVIIPKTGNAHEEQFIDVGNNGRPQLIERGVWTKVRRKYVEVLARAKKDYITTPEYVDFQGNRAAKISKTPALLHNIEMRDRNPDGYAWLQRVLGEP